MKEEVEARHLATFREDLEKTGSGQHADRRQKVI